MADVAAAAVLMLQASAPLGKLAAELEASAEFQYVVHQASGMVSAQLEVSVGQALIRLRAYAFGNDRPLAEVARDVVARTLRFDTESGEKDPSP
jgi:ANTAR domain